MPRMKVLSTMGACAALAVGVLAGASPAQADDMTTCVSNNVGVSNISCLAYAEIPGTPSMGKVWVRWQLLPGSDKTTAKGGIWYTRAPIAGERTGSSSEPYPNPTSDQTCSSEANPIFTGCVTTYEGLSGSLALEFPLSMAGYRYIIHQSEYLTDPDGNVASGSAISDFTKDAVWVHKAYRYTYKGKTYTSRTCPPRALKKCTPIVNLVLNNDVGVGMPVSPSP